MAKIDFILDNFPNHYNKSKSSNLYKLLSALGSELDDFLLNLESVRTSRYVDDANGIELDKVASILNLKRFFNENDDLFRGRIKTKIQSFIGGGTVNAIKQVVETYLGVTPIIVEHYQEGENHPYFDNGVFNGLDYDSTVKNITSDFNGKVAGSTVENPNIAKRWAYTTLLSPSDFNASDAEAAINYSYISKIDTSVQSNNNKNNGYIIQQLFSFNLIRLVEDKYGPIQATDKVQWLKDNIFRITCNWWGNGSGPNGNKATLVRYKTDTNSYYTDYQVSHTSSAISRLQIGTTSPTTSIDSNGFVHFLAYADPSDGITASTINTDYINLEIMVNIGEDTDKLKLSIENGISYIEGNKITSVKTDLTLSSNTTSYIILNNSGIITSSSSPAGTNQIPLYTVTTTSGISSITDNRRILDPFHDFITNSNSITVQVPYDFTEGFLTIEDTINILKDTVAAGMALLIQVIGTYDETLTIKEEIESYFMVGFSGMGSSNLIGG